MSESLPPIAVIILTFQRTQYALETITAARRNLIYPDLRYYLADDGSHDDHYRKCLEALDGVNLIGHHTLPGGTYGKNINKAYYAVRDTCPLTLPLEDDFVLNRPLDLTPYANILIAEERLGMVRLGNLPINLDCFTEGYQGLMFLKIQKGRQYTFSGNPSLRHDRFWQSYGEYPGHLNPGDTEVSYDWHVRNTDGPEIIWPVDAGAWGYWDHIGLEQSYTTE